MKNIFLPLLMLVSSLQFTTAAELKVATYNLRRSGTLPHDRWANRAARCLELLKAEKFDIFGSQETQKFHIKTITGAGYKVIGEPRDTNPNPEYSCIFYNPETVEMLSHKTFWLSETPEVAGSRSWKTAYPRICTFGTFEHKASGKIFVFYNTHLDHKSLLARENGMKLVMKKIAAYKGDMPIILTGDFNSKPESNVYKITAGKLSDARYAAEKTLPGPDGTFHGYKSDPAAWRGKFPIDYIFVNEIAVKVKTFQVINDFKKKRSSSDHFPVVATIVLQ